MSGYEQGELDSCAIATHCKELSRGNRAESEVDRTPVKKSTGKHISDVTSSDYDISLLLSKTRTHSAHGATRSSKVPMKVNWECRKLLPYKILKRTIHCVHFDKTNELTD